jgi:hypothetical protein
MAESGSFKPQAGHQEFASPGTLLGLVAPILGALTPILSLQVLACHGPVDIPSSQDGRRTKAPL